MLYTVYIRSFLRNFYYTQFETEDYEDLPGSDFDYLAGSLYFNQKYANYAYYVFRGQKTIKIYAFDFKDLYFLYFWFLITYTTSFSIKEIIMISYSLRSSQSKL